MLAEYETLLEQIKLFLNQRRQENDNREKLPALPIQELRRQVAEALERLKHFQSRECAQRVDELLLHELPDDIAEQLSQIRGQLKLYEDDNAEELLGQLLEILEKEEEGK